MPCLSATCWRKAWLSPKRRPHTWHVRRCSGSLSSFLAGRKLLLRRRRRRPRLRSRPDFSGTSPTPPTAAPAPGLPLSGPRRVRRSRPPVSGTARTSRTAASGLPLLPPPRLRRQRPEGDERIGAASERFRRRCFPCFLPVSFSVHSRRRERDLNVQDASCNSDLHSTSARFPTYLPISRICSLLPETMDLAFIPTATVHKQFPGLPSAHAHPNPLPTASRTGQAISTRTWNQKCLR